MSRRNLFCSLVLFGAWLGCNTPEDRQTPSNPKATAPAKTAVAADLVLLDGNIVTVDDALGTVNALAVKDGRILAVGSTAEMQKHVAANTKVIKLEGRTAIPGFIEGHAHFIGVGNSKLILDLSKVRTWDEVVDMVAAAVKKAQPGEWIVGRGWHQEKWDRRPEGNVEGFPTHNSLSAVSPNNPVSLTHASGHAAFFNGKAMAIANVTKSTKNPAGGEILKDKSGHPIGVFRETAASLVGRFQRTNQLPRARTPHEVVRRKIELAAKECLSKGVTSFQDAGSSFGSIDQFKYMAKRGRLGVRLYVMIRSSNSQLAKKLKDYRMINFADHHLTVRAVKRTIDGALGSRGAWLFEPYDDSPHSTGLATAGRTPKAAIASVTRTAQIAADHGFQVCVHAIGDRANHEVLNIYEKLFETPENGKVVRWRIEHAQHIHPNDIPRFAQMGVIASMQGVHCTSDALYVIPRLGKQRAREGAYVWQDLMKSGAVVTNGTDAPVEDVDPIASFYATVSRKTRDGTRFFPKQRMSRMEALKSYTIQCAYAAFEENDKGTLTPGKLADIVVLSKDIMTVPEERILDAEVLLTIVGGVVKYEAGN